MTRCSAALIWRLPPWSSRWRWVFPELAGERRDAGARIVGEIAGAQRFATAAKLARAAGVAPIPASSGDTHRQRLDRGGNRQINAALHRVIVTRARCHQHTRDYLERRRREGKSTREAIRCLKTYLARRVWRLLQPPHPAEQNPLSPSIS